MHPRATELIEQLQLQPHPEGGHYRRVYESASRLVHGGVPRPLMTAIRFLLAAGERSAWHRVDADEAWHWQEGDALELLIFDETSGVQTIRLGAQARGGCAMHVVPAGAWQAARALGDYTLVGCTVSPGFVWEGFELLTEDSPFAASLPPI